MESIKNMLNSDTGLMLLRVLAIVLVGILLIKLLSIFMKRVVLRTAKAQVKLLINKVLVYSLYLILMSVILAELGIQLTAILGTIGILGIVVGIASQTSIGNVISGIFLISENAFEIGDILRVDNNTGVVYSIDLLSIKLKTFDNLLVRIPNQTLISAQITNITKFPYRRQDFNLRVAYDTDLVLLKDILTNIVKETPHCLTDPEPLVMIQNFGVNGIELLFGVWFENANFVKVRNEVNKELQKRFRQHQITVPYMQVSLTNQKTSEDLPINKHEE